MARKFDILIPIYNEGEKVVKPLLDSIALQQNVDFNEIGIIICCDGGNTVISEEFKANYPFIIEFYQCEHEGVSATRNACLDYSKADYVMFCDCDDMFCNVCGLWILFREFKDGFETLVSVFTEETRDKDKNVVYANHDMDSTFVHGKVHNRKFLINNNIRWNENLTIHEDSYFNILCQRLAQKEQAKFCTIPFYLWKWRDESVCRHDEKYILKTYNNMLESNTALVNQFKDRFKMDEAKEYALSMIYDAYFTLNCDDWIEINNKEYREAVEHRFKQYWLEFKDLIKDMPKDIKLPIISSIRQRFYMMNGLINESQTFDQWIKHIEEL